MACAEDTQGRGAKVGRVLGTVTTLVQAAALYGAYHAASLLGMTWTAYVALAGAGVALTLCLSVQRDR